MSKQKQLTRRSVAPNQEAFDTALPNQQLLAGAFLIVGLVLLIYWPAIHGGFILDDNVLLTDNPQVKAPDGLYRIWFTREPIDYWPISNSSFWLQWRLWGMNPTGYHVVNLLLHVANCLLIWLLLKRLSIPGAFLAAMLFAVHPVNVESVAWIAQLKTLLSMLFLLASVLCYLKAQRTFNYWYFFSLIAFIFAMLSKGSVAILPAVLFLMLWWQNQRITAHDIWQVAPFFAIAIALTITNIWVQTHGAHITIRTATDAQRLTGAAAALWFYLFKALLPINLVFVYPQWNIDATNLLWWLPLIATSCVTIVLWRICSSAKKQWLRNLFVAWLFFCLALLPALGFVDVGYMKYSLVADHYQYIALIGVIALVGAGVTLWQRSAKKPINSATALGATAVVAVLAILTWQQNHIYANSITLYEATAKQNPTSWLIQTILSLDLARLNRPKEAKIHAQEAIRLNPDYAEAHYALGVALAGLGQTDEAMQQYRRALEIDPNYAEAASNLGAALGRKGQSHDAVEYLQRAVALKPFYFEAHSNLGRALTEVGRLPEALEQLQIAVQLHPDDAEGEVNMGNIAHRLNHNQEALSHFQQALRIKANFPEAYVRIALVFGEMNRSTDAISAAQTGIDIARATGDFELAQQLQAWLTNYRANLSNPPVQNR